MRGSSSSARHQTWQRRWIWAEIPVDPSIPGLCWREGGGQFRVLPRGAQPGLAHPAGWPHGRSRSLGGAGGSLGPLGRHRVHPGLVERSAARGWSWSLGPASPQGTLLGGKAGGPGQGRGGGAFPDADDLAVLTSVRENACSPALSPAAPSGELAHAALVAGPGAPALARGRPGRASSRKLQRKTGAGRRAADNCNCRERELQIGLEKSL